MNSITKRLLRPILLLFLIIVIFLATQALVYALFPANHLETIDKYCRKYDVDTHLVLALIKAESNFSENAQSRAGAKGLMQITEDTFSYCIDVMGLRDNELHIQNPHDNIRIGVWYLSLLLKKYDGNIENSVAAYNAGPGNVDNWLSDKKASLDGKKLFYIPFDETFRHVKKINLYTKIYKLLYSGR